MISYPNPVFPPTNCSPTSNKMPSFLRNSFMTNHSPALSYSNSNIFAAAATNFFLRNGQSDAMPLLSYYLGFDSQPSNVNPFSYGAGFVHEEPKPNHSYIGLISMAILSSPEKKLVLSEIYQYILENYAYFRTKGPGWRNSIRHNLSLNDCFVKAGRSANGKGHYWAIHSACIDDFSKGDFRRRHAQRKVRKAMGLSMADEDSDGNHSPNSSVEHLDNFTDASDKPPTLDHINDMSPVKRLYKNCCEETLSDKMPVVPISGPHSPPACKRRRGFDIASLLSDSDLGDEHTE